MEPLILLLLMGLGFVAAFIDAMVGGGGAITLPALLVAGVDPHVALGTNKLAATGASLSASLRYARAQLLLPSLTLPLLPVAGLASALGAWTALQLPATHLRTLVLVVMAAMTLYVLLRPRFGTQDNYQRPTAPKAVTITLLAGAIGFYDGILGPGTGTFLIFALVGVLGMDFMRAAAHGRVLNLASNAGALTLFLLMDRADYAIGLPMMATMIIGGHLGSRFALQHGTRWIRPLFVTITLLLMARLLLF